MPLGAALFTYIDEIFLHLHGKKIGKSQEASYGRTILLTGM
jgi:hypothetical protein